MPNTKTAKKNLRKSVKRNLINKSARTAIKNIKKKILETAFNMVKSTSNANDVILSVKDFMGKLHSKSRKNPFDKLRAARFESRFVAKIRKMVSAS